MTRLSPKGEALAFRIWAHATPLSWDLTARDIADALDVKVRSVSGVCAAKGWTTRLRASTVVRGSEGMINYVDEFLEGM